MTRHAARARRGITLVEILISILIMGVGVISIATLFPLGLLRLRNAQRLTRGAYLIESAVGDLGARDLLNQQSFKVLSISPWYQTPASGQYYPWLQDTAYYGGDWKLPATALGNPAGASRANVPGLPVCYDPLWRCVTGLYPDPAGKLTPECRFGAGVGYLRSDPNPGSTLATPSAHGLQRVTNLQSHQFSLSGGLTSPYAGNIVLGNVGNAQFVQNTLSVIQTFVSPEDVVTQDAKGDYLDPLSVGSKFPSKMISPSSVVPALSDSSKQLNASGVAYLNSPANDWRFTWFFTGALADANGTIFEGEVVVCENRPFGLDQTVSGSQYKVSGETVVEAVWGYSSAPAVVGKSPYYASPGANRTVLLRWPVSQPDPDLKVGNWIADVTYERNQAVVDGGRFPYAFQPQRCHWYQVGKRTEPDYGVAFTGDGGVSYRQMTVWTTTPVQAQSLIDFTTTPPSPYHVEAALIMPSVINVYPRTVYSRPNSTTGP